MIDRWMLALVLSLAVVSMPTTLVSSPRQSPADMVEWSYLDVIAEATLRRADLGCPARQ